MAKKNVKDVKKPITIADIKDFIKQTRQDFQCHKICVDDVWETGDTQDIAEAARQEGREEILLDLEDYLKRGN